MARARVKRPLKERRRRARILLGALGAVVVVGIFVAAIAALNNQSLRVSDIEVVGAGYTREDLVRQVVSDEISGTFVWVIPKDSALMYPRGDVERAITETFPAVHSVDLRRKSLTALSVVITERIPDARWCLVEEITERCFLLDPEGRIFAKDSGGAELQSPVKFYGLLSGDPLSQVYAGGFYPEIRALADTLALATGETISSVRLDEVGDIFVILAGGGEVRLTTKNVGQELTDTVASVFASRRFDTDQKLEYADFRFGSKVYVKFEGE